VVANISAIIWLRNFFLRGRKTKRFFDFNSFISYIRTYEKGWHKTTTMGLSAGT
jgi:hypothetical protein